MFWLICGSYMLVTASLLFFDALPAIKEGNDIQWWTYFCWPLFLVAFVLHLPFMVLSYMTRK
jgi:hypothetical protein